MLCPSSDLFPIRCTYKFVASVEDKDRGDEKGGVGTGCVKLVEIQNNGKMK